MSWSPARIRNIWQWIDAAQSGLYTDTGGTTPVASAGDAVKRAADLSGNNNHDTEATNAPTYRATDFLGSKCIRFTAASSQKLTSTNNFAAKADTGFSMYMVYQSSSAANAWWWGVASATRNFAFFWRAASGWYTWYTGTTDNAEHSYLGLAPVINTPEIQGFRYDNTQFGWQFQRSTFRKPTGTGATPCGYKATTGSLGISGLPFITGGYPGGGQFGSFDLAEKIIVERCVGDAEDAEIRGYLADKYSLGNKPGLIWSGDSLTDGYNGTETANSLPHKAAALLDAAGVNYVWQRNSYGGRYMYQWQQEYESDLRPHLLRFNGARSVVALWFGANDVHTYGAAAHLANVKEACQRITADGGLPIPCTLMHRGDQASFDAKRLTFNSDLRTTYRAFAPAIIDYGADAILGPAAAVDNLTYFQADKIHLTAAGNARAAAVAYPIVKSALEGAMDRFSFSTAARGIARLRPLGR